MLLLLSAVVLTGCTSGPVTGTPTPSAPFVEPVLDPNGWTQDVTFDDFVAAFPDLDTTELASIPEINVQHNDRAWALGSGASGLGDVKVWIRSFAELEAEDDDEIEFTAITVTDDRAISFFLRDMGDDGQFYLLVTSSI